MGNLGKYQDIATEAKRVGGVDKLIEIIEESAVAKAYPKSFGKGAGVGALGMLAVGGIAIAVRRHLDSKRAREEIAHEAKEQLKDKAEGSTNSHGTELGNGEGKSHSDRGEQP